MIAELDEADSEDDIAEQSSVFSSHSVFSNNSGGSRPSPSHTADSKSVFSKDISKSSPSRQQIDSKSVKKEKDESGKHSRKKSKNDGQEKTVKHSTLNSSGTKQTETAKLVHSESKGFDIDTRADVKSEISLPESMKTNISIGDEAPVEILESPNGEDLTELVALQRKLMSIKDPNILVKVVMLIQKVGKFQVTDSTFDFDLYSLDSGTVQEIRTCLNQT